MKTLLFCMLGLGLTACGSSPKGTNGDQDELAMLIKNLCKSLNILYGKQGT